MVWNDTIFNMCRCGGAGSQNGRDFRFKPRLVGVSVPLERVGRTLERPKQTNPVAPLWGLEATETHARKGLDCYAEGDYWHSLYENGVTNNAADY